MVKKGSRTAEFLERAIHGSGKTQTEIARDAGLKKPNALSMMKRGQTKIPIARIPALAKACGVDELRFVRLALEEYHPELLDVILSTLGDSVSENEWKVVDAYRAACQGEEIELDTHVTLRLMGVLQDIKERQAKGKWPPRSSGS